MKKTKVLVGGTFDILHPGHIHFLKKAKSLGDYLVVIIANDRTAINSGKNPVFSAKERAAVIRELRFVDSVRIGYPLPKNTLKIVFEEKPDIIALGYDQKFPGLDRLGTKMKIARIRRFGNYSTRKILNNK